MDNMRSRYIQHTHSGLFRAFGRQINKYSVLPPCRLRLLKIAFGEVLDYFLRLYCQICQLGLKTLKMLDYHSADVAFNEDRMYTDIIVGIESNIDTILVLSGVTKQEDFSKFPYQPKYVLNGVGDILNERI